MVNLILAAVLAAAPATQGSFHKAPLAGYKAVYEQANDYFMGAKDEAFNTFALMLADAYIVGHKEEAMGCAAKKGLQQAPPECVWPLPYANDWLGCMFYQFDNPKVFGEYHFETFQKEPVLQSWINKNTVELNKTAPGAQFIATLTNLPALAQLCEDEVKDDVPAGSINVGN